MGYSCASKAAYTEAAITDACVKSTGSSNAYVAADGTHYFLERGREQRDGAITGTIMRMIGETSCRKAGTYRIDPDGTLVRGSAFMKKAVADGAAEIARKSAVPTFVGSGGAR